MTSVLLAAAFSGLLLSGVMLFVSPPGRVANWTNWTLLGLRKHEWTGIHIWFGILFLLVALGHLFFNWRPMFNYFKDRTSRRPGVRLEWVVAFVICGAVYGGTRAAIPPFSSVLSFNERVKGSWDTARERAPIPHAELLTLAELAQRAGVDLASVTNLLRDQGIQGFSPDIIVQQLADGNQRSAQQIYAMLSTPSKEVSRHGEAPGRGGRAGGGPGWKTLAQFCTEEGIEVEVAVAQLKSKGIRAEKGETMREIAVNNGYDRPYALIDIIRAK